MTHGLVADGGYDLIRRCSKQICDDRELVYVVLAGEKRFALQHLCENTPDAPDVDPNVILLPCEHDFRGAIVSRRHIAGHLRVLYTGKTEIANLEIAVLIDEDIAWFQITVNHASRMHEFQPALYNRSPTSG